MKAVSSFEVLLYFEKIETFRYGNRYVYIGTFDLKKGILSIKIRN